MTVALPRLFVYGTLQPGRLRWPFLAPYAGPHRRADVAGQLYDSGHGWPVATFTVGATVVPGTLVDLDDVRLDEVLAVLDDVESAATDLLVRVRVTTTTGIAAWAYHCAAPPPAMRPIDRWMPTDER